MVRHAPIHRRSGHSDIAICCGRNVRGSSPSTSVVPLSNQVTTLNHKRFKGFKMFSDGHLGIHLPPVFVPMLSFIVFWSAITLGQAIQYTRIIKTQVIADKYEGKSFQLGSWRTLLCAVSIIVAESWWTMDIWNMDSIVASYITIPAALENSQWFAMIPIKVSTV